MKFFRTPYTKKDFCPPILLNICRKLFSNSVNPAVPEWIVKGTPIIQYHHPVFESFSQFGEDLMLDILLNHQQDGIYVDIGANDPIIINNTYKFYKRGWRGINIEPGHTAWKKLCELRPEDTNLQVGAGSIEGFATFYEMSLDSTSTFSQIASRSNFAGQKIVASYEMPVITLTKIFDQYLVDKVVDFLSIDVEGSNLDVLMGNDWKKNRPHFILIEMQLDERPSIFPFLKKKGYQLVYDNTLNGIFMDSGFCNLGKK